MEQPCGSAPNETLSTRFRITKHHDSAGITRTRKYCVVIHQRPRFPKRKAYCLASCNWQALLTQTEGNKKTGARTDGESSNTKFLVHSLHIS